MEKCFSGELLCSGNSVGYTFFCFIPVKTEKTFAGIFFSKLHSLCQKRKKTLKCNRMWQNSKRNKAKHFLSSTAIMLNRNQITEKTLIEETIFQSQVFFQ